MKKKKHKTKPRRGLMATQEKPYEAWSQDIATGEMTFIGIFATPSEAMKASAKFEADNFGSADDGLLSPWQQRRGSLIDLEADAQCARCQKTIPAGAQAATLTPEGTIEHLNCAN